MSWIIENKEWLFSGVGIAVIGVIYTKFFSNRVSENKPSSGNSNLNKNSIVINNNDVSSRDNCEKTITEKDFEHKSLDQFKNDTKILFIDDDARFKVSKILVKSGWVHTKLIKDCESLDNADVGNADILFIDVQGVGVAMGFADEGLGLALAIKQKYPTKKVVIYSAETQGDRFHEALRKADSFLPKNADPYEFQRIVEEFTIGCSE